MSGRGAETLVDHFRAVFADRPDRRTFRFLVDGEGEPLSLTNAEFDRRVRALAASMRERVPAGERALIICPSGLEYVTSFFACLYSGIIAVPVYPPDPSLLQRTLPRLLGVIEDAEPAVVLALSDAAAVKDQFAEYAPALGNVRWQAVDDVDLTAAENWTRPEIHTDSLAFLQYTSGSTSRPKGVMVGHDNLMHNLAHLNGQFFGMDDDSHMVSWLPPYHDMGLIAGLLSPVFGGYPVTFMSPFSFLKRPFRWLKAISDHRGTLSGGPNFAYDLCAAKISDAEREQLDLSSWQVTLNGAEPVRMETIDRFTETFAPHGFRRHVFLPAYGLAEGTLAVSGGELTGDPIHRQLRADALGGNEIVDAKPGEDARRVVACGWSLADQEIVIADPTTRERLPEGRVGEIWVGGASVAKGYWQRPDATAEIFDAHLTTGEGPYLRTGDLGFLDGVELYVTGRIKDIIIIDGRNHYPQDIERTVEAVDTTALRPGCGIAGTREIDGQERLIVVQEVAVAPGRFDADAVIAKIRATVAAEHGVPVHAVALVKRGTVPKTSSGKLQRQACLNAFTDGTLKTVALSVAEPATAPTPPTPVDDGIETAVREELAKLVGTPAAELDPTAPFASYGLKSVDLVAMVGELERRLDRTLAPTVVWEHPTVEQLAAHLGGAAPAAAAAEPVAAEQEPIAIVGIGCRFPGGVDGPDSFWQLLMDGRDAITEVPPERWDVEKFGTDDPATPGRTTSRWGGFLDGVDQFDPHFFGIPPAEAARMDPQQRLLAEVAWEALEDAGVPAEKIAGSATGVFVGISSFDYAAMQLRDLTTIDAYTGTGSALSIAANRLSYLLDLRGPSMAVDSACSSSLVAVLQACASLERGECATAIAGGVNLVLSPAFAINFSKAGAMSPDGRCKPFDDRANGYVRAEGAGVVVLKPLSKALADQDPVYGVIRGGAVVQDGRSNGIMAPNPAAQEAVLRAAYDKAGIEPSRVHYVEAHGTGTMLGDPIEAKALGAVLGAGRDVPCLVGSVKSNVGHMEAAAGIGGLIKAALMVRHRVVPASLHYENPNPHIPFAELGLEVAATTRPWPVDEPAVVGVSSFGFGGTNSHVVVEQAPSTPDTPAGIGAQLLAISARTEPALRELAARYETALADTDASAAALAFASTVRRTHHEHRVACVGDSPAAFRDALAAYRSGEESDALVAGPRRVGRKPKVAFVFSGQGPKWWPLSADLLDEPVFHGVLSRCDTILRRHVDWSLLERLTTPTEDDGQADTDVWQPALFAVQVALAALWRSWGVEPATVVGHSVGEISAAYTSGAITLEDGLTTALHRGRVLTTAAGKGRMALVGVGVERAREILAERRSGGVWVAASNSPHSTVLSGTAEAIVALAAELEAAGVFCRVLESVGFASHCPLMEPVASELWQLLGDLTPRASALPMISTVTGAPIDGERLDAEYWAANLTSPVLFDKAVTALADTGHDVVVELSPHPMLRDAVTERFAEQQADGIAVASLRREESGRAALLTALGDLYTAGFPIDWAAVSGADGPMTPLPSYPWQRERCWLPESRDRQRPDGHPALETTVRAAVEPHTAYFAARVDLTGFPYLDDHRVGGSVVLPAAFLLDAALAAAREVAGPDAVVTDVELTRMTVVPDAAENATLQVVLTPETDGAGSVQIFTDSGTGWEPAAHGRFHTERAEISGDIEDVRRCCDRPIETDELYQRLHAAGLEYGLAFQGMGELWAGTGEALARLRPLTSLTADADPYLVHPALLDSSLQTLVAAIGADLTETYLPVGVGAVTLTAAGAPHWAHATVGAADGDELRDCVVTLFDEAGAVLGRLSGVTLRKLDRGQHDDAGTIRQIRWHESIVDAGEALSGTWLLLADGAFGERLRAELEGRGASCVIVGTEPGADHVVNPLVPQEITELFAELGPLAGVVHAWHTETTGAAWTDAAASVLHTVQAMAGAAEPARLVLVTRGAQQVDDEAPSLVGAPLWGLAKVAGLEHAELAPVLIDLDPAGTADEAARVADELCAAHRTEQVALRGEHRYVPRLDGWTPGEDTTDPVRRPFEPDTDGNHQLLALRPGILDSLTPTRCDRVSPGPGQVQVEVTAAGLNFADVLKALDVCPGVGPGIVPLGAECAGRITAVGEGVARFQVGDPVMVTAPSSMAGFVTTSALLVAPMPAGLTDEQAAGVPIAFLTAVYGLEYLARLRAGEKVLVHAATGGVGLAALMVARRCGAEVYATAGTETKRKLVRDLGVEHVFDSRTLAFADEISALTGGRGVDVVLNSTTGEALTRSLALLAPGGRFVEIGKRDIYGDSRINLGHLKHNRSFFAVDLERSVREEHELISDLFRIVCRGFETGEFEALPTREYPYSSAGAAFSLMAQAQHIGKVVLVPDPVQEIAVRGDGAPVRGTATYLITGGLGGLGLRTAQYLAEQGATHLVLVGRNAPSTEARAVLDELRAQDVTVEVRAADVSRRAEVDALVAEIGATMPPLTGIVHAAGVLDDGTLLSLDRDRFDTVAAPKAHAAWHLHESTVDTPLDFFVLYSSAAALLGSAGQGNYAAANAFLDALALHRRANGLPALTVNWGPWTEVGLAARPDRGGALAAKGIRGITPDEGAAALDRLLRTPTAQACVLPLDVDALRADAGLLPTLLTHLAGPVAEAVDSGFRQQVLAVEPGRRRVAMFVEQCTRTAAQVLKLDQDKIDPAAPLSAMGFDSLLSLELRKRLEATFQVSLPATLTWRFPTIDVLVPYLAECMEIALTAPKPETPPESTPDEIDLELDGLSDDELEALLLAKTEQIDEGR
jgi:acyl transferase domain-containing protein/acyl-CoA synthetase (AMP-forming)/AMP-acid ligase II/acyl carrier protein